MAFFHHGHFADVTVSIGGGLFVVLAGYLVWRHEQTIQAANQAAQNAQQQNVADQTIQQLQAQLQAMQEQGAWYGQSYGQSYPATDYSQVGGTTLQGVPQDTMLASILSAFFGQQQGQVATSTAASPTGTASSTTTQTTTPSTTTQVQSNPASLSSLDYSTSVLGGVVNSGTGLVSAINTQQASNPLLTSQVGASSGTAAPATGAQWQSSNNQYNRPIANPIVSTGQ
jgi:hypothetical protein